MVNTNEVPVRDDIKATGELNWMDFENVGKSCVNENETYNMELRKNELTKIFQELLPNNHFVLDKIGVKIINVDIYTSFFDKGLNLETLNNIANKFNDYAIQVIPYKPYIIKLIIDDNRYTNYSEQVIYSEQQINDLIPEVKNVINDFLGDAGREFFENIKNEHGTVWACYMEDGVPHSIWNWEGRQIRNYVNEKFPGLVSSFGINESNKKDDNVDGYALYEDYIAKILEEMF